MAKLKSCLPYLGGKHRLAKNIISFFPPHKVYVEVFGGGASVLIQKDSYTSDLEVYNDINSDVVNFFRVLRDKKRLAKLLRNIKHTPYSREEFYNFRDTWKECTDVDERVFRWYAVAKLAFGGHWQGRARPSFGFNLIERRFVLKFHNSINTLELISDRFSTVQVENLSWEKLIGIYDSKDTLFYLDPPYLNRRDSKYDFDFNITDSVRLIDKILNIKGKAIISGYKHKIHNRLEKNNWRRFDFNATIFSQGASGEIKNRKKRRVIDSIWISPNCNTKLSRVLK